MTIQGFVREVGPDDEWVRAQRSWVMDGFRLVIIDLFERSSGWRRLSQPRVCRYMAEHKGCGRPAVVELVRGYTKQPWGYCERHLYACRWEPPRLLAPIVVPVGEQP